MQSYVPSMIKQRKWVHGVFGEASAMKKLDVIQRRETYVLLTGLMTTPGDFVRHIERCAPRTYCAVSSYRRVRHVSAMVLESIYGHRITSLEDEYVTLMSRAMQAITATGAVGMTLADMLPIRKFERRLLTTGEH